VSRLFLRAHHLAFIVAAAWTMSVSGSAAAKLGPEHVIAVEHWVSAVASHTPGRADDVLASVVALTYDERRQLSEALELFFDALFGRNPSTSSAAAERIARIGADTLSTTGAKRFLIRAAVLHGDAVLMAPDVPAPPPDPRDAQAADGQILSASDGEYKGVLQPAWHAKFARDLLDRMPPRPSGDPFVGQWYHAMVASLMAGRRYGEAALPLRRAAELLPNDAAILFDRACLAEVMGLPWTQQVLMDPRAQQPTGSPAPARAASGRSTLGPGSVRTNASTEGMANAEAERLFRRVLEIDATRADARLRLGRLLITRKRYAEADAELTRALATTRDRSTTYLAHLFASRAEARIGRFERAAAHVDAALVLFPDAQSGLVARSQLALQRADVTAAVEPIQRLGEIDHTRQPPDPWSEYDIGPGRDAKALLAGMWVAASR